MWFGASLLKESNLILNCAEDPVLASILSEDLNAWIFELKFKTHRNLSYMRLRVASALPIAFILFNYIIV